MEFRLARIEDLKQLKIMYKEIIKNLLHPSGLKIYSNLNKKEEISIFNFDIESYIQIN